MIAGTKPEPTTEVNPEERVKRLERRAKVVRSRLLRAVDALDRRRHEVVDIGERAKDLALPAALAVGGIAVLFGASAWAFGRAFSARRRPTLGARLVKQLQGLDLLAARRPSFGRQLFEKVTLAVVTYAATEAAKQISKNALDGRLPNGHLVDESGSTS